MLCEIGLVIIFFVLLFQQRFVQDHHQQSSGQFRYQQFGERLGGMRNISELRESESVVEGQQYQHPKRCCQLWDTRASTKVCFITSFWIFWMCPKKPFFKHFQVLHNKIGAFKEKRHHAKPILKELEVAQVIIFLLYWHFLKCFIWSIFMFQFDTIKRFIFYHFFA